MGSIGGGGEGAGRIDSEEMGKEESRRMGNGEVCGGGGGVKKAE
jgi:hypothetical protein